MIYILSHLYKHSKINWRAAGVSIPIFSLRSENSFGIGEFSDLNKLIDWAAKSKLKIVQILPVNDTTISGTWSDSYPYNAISTYALHPLYLGLHQYPLKNKEQNNKYIQKAKALNSLKLLDYEQVLSLKNEYIRELFVDYGNEKLSSTDYLSFYAKNEHWLFSYACFTYLRDKYQTAEHRMWKDYKIYNKENLARLLSTDKEARYKTNLCFFYQYLLHKQLTGAKEYAHQNGIILKGDIPIGISADSVEAWTEPHLFNMDVQTGAPPDDFSIYGQNWGFPTYNWDEMSKDNYQWWKLRFMKMADYFDAYRIDHILGFFRIWEIPYSEVQGLLGYFNPALPYTVEELTAFGIAFNEKKMAQSNISDRLLTELFGENKEKIVHRFLFQENKDEYLLIEEYNTQKKVELQLKGDAPETKQLREALYRLFSEVLFICDKKETNKYHPRINSQHTYLYQQLTENEKTIYNRLYNNFFYERHNDFWREEAMKKLSELISATQLLVCGEDLGMIPNCVPEVMKTLEILSLEIERMPKKGGVEFSQMSDLPYESVCTTSTHDMSPIRLWWTEDKDIIQRYYNNVEWKEGIAPHECSFEICKQIILNHLNSPSMLTIIPIQDWFSIYNKFRVEDPSEERINIPSEPKHYWRYRMHITLEKLLEENNFANAICEMLKISDRV